MATNNAAGITIHQRMVASEPVTDRLGPRSTPMSTASRIECGTCTTCNAPPASSPDGRLFITFDNAAIPNDAASSPAKRGMLAHHRNALLTS